MSAPYHPPSTPEEAVEAHRRLWHKLKPLEALREVDAVPALADLAKAHNDLVKILKKITRGET